jgi:hypothetical protein
MQIRACSFTGDRPRCFLNPGHKVHSHGSYERYANCNDNQMEAIARFLCVPCGRTISVLLAHFLPYRPVPVSLVEKYFDAQVNPGQSQEPPVTEKEAGCLKRAWIRFDQRMTALAAVLGQMLQIRVCAPKPFWLALRRLGNLPDILLRLANPFNTSLLHDYLCLRPWTNSSS